MAMKFTEISMDNVALGSNNTLVLPNAYRQYITTTASFIFEADGKACGGFPKNSVFTCSDLVYLGKYRKIRSNTIKVGGKYILDRVLKVYQSKNSSTTSTSSTNTTTTSTTTTATATIQNTENLVNDELYASNLDNQLSLYSINDDIYSEITKYTNTFGAPFLLLQSTDPCYYYNRSEVGTRIYVGRTYLETLYSNPAVLSLCPGKVNYLPGVWNNDTKNEFFSDLAKKFEADTSVSDRSAFSGGTGVLSKQLYDFACDYNDYMNRLNVLARVSAIMLGLGDTVMPGTNIPLSKYDYSYFTTSSRSDGAQKDTNSFLWQLETGLSSAFSDKQYIHFFITNEGTSVTEAYTTNSAESPLNSFINNDTLQSTAANLSYLFGGAMSTDGFVSNAMEDVDKLISDMAATGSFAGSFASMARGYLSGGRMIIPDYINEVGYENTIACKLVFRAIYGDPLNVFLQTVLPTLAILTFAWPKQLAENMYTFPYIVRSYQKGIYNSDLAYISNLDVRRGGQDGFSWTESGLSTEIEVNFNITPLYSEIMGGNGRNPFLFMSNGALLEYLGNLCGVDLKVNQVSLKLELAERLVANYVQDIPDLLGRKISTDLKNWIGDLFSF